MLAAQSNVEKSNPAATKLWEEAKSVRSNPDSFLGRHTGIARTARPFAELGAGVLRGVETVGNIAARKDGRSRRLRLKRPLRDYARKRRVRHRNPLPGLGPRGLVVFARVYQDHALVVSQFQLLENPLDAFLLCRFEVDDDLNCALGVAGPLINRGLTL